MPPLFESATPKTREGGRTEREMGKVMGKEMDKEAWDRTKGRMEEWGGVYGERMTELQYLCSGRDITVECGAGGLWRCGDVQR
jgi:hypothetical protein